MLPARQQAFLPPLAADALLCGLVPGVPVTFSAKNRLALSTSVKENHTWKSVCVCPWLVQSLPLISVLFKKQMQCYLFVKTHDGKTITKLVFLPHWFRTLRRNFNGSWAGRAVGVSVLWLQVAFEKDSVLWILWWLVVAESTLMEQGESQSSQVSGQGGT